MNRAVDVAKYVINYANDHNYQISNLKLQKILYYTQAAFLVESEGIVPCFSDKIFAWLHGPVVENVYYAFSSYGGNSIPRQDYIEKVVYKNKHLTVEKYPFSDTFFGESDRVIINRVLQGLLCYDAWDLVNRTHQEQPWKEKKGTNEEIKLDQIYAYFRDSMHRRRIYGDFN